MAGRDGPGLAETLSRSLDLLARRRPREALTLLASLGPAQFVVPAVQGRLAYAHALLGEIAKAEGAARAVAENPAAEASALDLAGNALTLCHRPAEAYDAFRRAAALAPGNPALQYNLAATAAFLGRTDEAEAAYTEVIRRDPAAWEAYRARSDLRRQSADSNHIAELEAALFTRQPPTDGEIRLRYALGKEYEDVGDVDRAFDNFDLASKLRRSRLRYDVAEDIAALDLIGEVFDAAYAAPARVRTPGDGPIFILGLPRTGSTLLERMLGRHPDIQPLGELQAFGAALVAGLRRQAGPPPTGKLEAIQASAAVDPAEVGRDYLAAVAPLRDGRANFTDKLPFNILYTAIIARALPQARIVHLTRDPLDACVAIYKTLFEEAYPYAYDLAELGAYHNAYRRLAAHWREVLGERFIEVAYEDLVGDPAAQITRLLARLDLPTADACLAPERDDSPVMTASAAQVRAPVHARSVGIASRYIHRLAPLLAVLEPG
jgi:tetratricopeptide (TPR) repeat protein